LDRSNHADKAPAIDVGGGDAATSQATFTELVPSALRVFSRLCGGHEWQGEIDDEKAYGFKSYNVVQVALLHALGKLPTPEGTPRFW